MPPLTGVNQQVLDFNINVEDEISNGGGDYELELADDPTNTANQENIIPSGQKRDEPLKDQLINEVPIPALAKPSVYKPQYLPVSTATTAAQTASTTATTTSTTTSSDLLDPPRFKPKILNSNATSTSTSTATSTIEKPIGLQRRFDLTRDTHRIAKMTGSSRSVSNLDDILNPEPVANSVSIKPNQPEVRSYSAMDAPGRESTVVDNSPSFHRGSDDITYDYPTRPGGGTISSSALTTAVPTASRKIPSFEVNERPRFGNSYRSTHSRATSTASYIPPDIEYNSSPIALNRRGSDGYRIGNPFHHRNISSESFLDDTESPIARRQRTRQYGSLTPDSSNSIGEVAARRIGSLENQRQRLESRLPNGRPRSFHSYSPLNDHPDRSFTREPLVPNANRIDISPTITTASSNIDSAGRRHGSNSYQALTLDYMMIRQTLKALEERISLQEQIQSNIIANDPELSMELQDIPASPLRPSPTHQRSLSATSSSVSQSTQTDSQLNEKETPTVTTKSPSHPVIGNRIAKKWTFKNFSLIIIIISLLLYL